MRMNLDGTVEGTPKEIAEFVALTKKKEPEKKRGTKPKEVETVEISDTLAKTLALLSNHDGPTPASDIAKEMGLKPATAVWRLNKLEKLGVITKPVRGVYEA